MSVSSLSSLRESTQKAHEKAQETYQQTGTGRTVLGTLATATIMRGEGHDCKKVEQEHAAEKVSRRFFGSYGRMSISYYLDCQTWRGRTEKTGQSSSCGDCQGSHWCLTPTLC